MMTIKDCAEYVLSQESEAKTRIDGKIAMLEISIETLKDERLGLRDKLVKDAYRFFLSENGYDPEESATFFERINAELQ